MRADAKLDLRDATWHLNQARAISKSGYRLCVRSRANLLSLRMILSENQFPLFGIMR
jgi:hypothetical protein